MPLSHSYMYYHYVVTAFLEVALLSFNKLRDHVTYRNVIEEYKKRVVINHVTDRNGIILFTYVFQVW